MTSLQSRLALWLGLSLLLVFGAFGLLMSQFPRYLAEGTMVTRLSHDGEGLLARLLVVEGQPIALHPGPLAPIYQTPFSGHYFRIESGGAVLRSPSLWDEDLHLRPLPPGQTHDVQHIRGPDGQPLLAWVQRVRFGGREVTVAVAEDVSHIEQDIRRFRTQILLGMGVTLGVLLLLQAALVRHSLRPVQAATRELRAVEQGRARAIRTRVPSEVAPLVTEINRLLGAMQRRIERSRNATGNLAHAIKTPLSVLGQLRDRPGLRDQPALRAELDQAIGSIRTAIERELKRARLAGPVAPGQQVDLARELADLVDVMRKVHGGRDIAVDLHLPRRARVCADREDLLELMGNLLDNAFKWARRRIRVDARLDGGLTLVVADDGPGIAADALAAVTARGTRLDENQPGHGLGLAIVNDIVAQYEGSIDFGRDPALGGLRVELHLPLACSE